MPNWCDNTVTITAKNQETIDTIKAAIYREVYEPNEELSDTFLHLNKLIPLVDENGNQTEYSYTTAVEQWGTKTMDCEITGWDDIGEKQIFIAFYSAWDAPLEFYKQLVKKFDIQLSATYEEVGNCFAGEYAANHIEDDNNIDVICDEHWEITYDEITGNTRRIS